MGFLAGRSAAKGISPAMSVPLGLAYPWLRIAVGLAVLAAIGIFAIAIGSVYIPPWTVARILLDSAPLIDVSQTWPDAWDTIVWQLRFPRIILAGMVGAALAVSGATYQGLFRNPLADPFFLGVAAGAALGATVVLLTSVPVYFGGFSLLPLAAFAGAIATVSVTYAIVRRSSGLPLTSLILAGVAMSSLVTAVTSLLIIRSDPDVKPLLGWLMGGLIGSQWDDIYTSCLMSCPVP